MQTGNTNTMIFGVQKLVSYLSYFVTLTPGDIVSTGTPPGVGAGIKPKPVFLKPGDTVRLGQLESTFTDAGALREFVLRAGG